jgi:hypothetical protein
MKFLRLGLVAISLLALSAGAAFAWGNASNCVDCHTDLNPNNEGGALHSAHAGGLVTECGYCHPAGGGLPVRTNESELAAENSCNGCHTLGGLYAKHGPENCFCHQANPPAPGLESDVPPYYGTAATPYGESRVCWDNLDNDGDGDVDSRDEDCANVDNEWKSWSTIKEHYGE